MRHEGTLRSWDDNKGFGFISPRSGGREVFVHVSAFARDGSRPTPGESLSYAIGAGKNGRPQAIEVTRKAIGRVLPKHRPTKQQKFIGPHVGRLVSAVLLTVLGVFIFKHLQGQMNRGALQVQEDLPAMQVPAAASPESQRCDGRLHCSQMNSCAEARWFINNCPGTMMDGDNDGVPCEQQWCTGAFSH